MRKIVRQVIDWGEPRFKRITMSHDASNNPAELVGIDGTICYRKEGGSCVELGSSTSLWTVEDVGAYPAITPNPSRNISLKKLKCIMNPLSVYIRLANPTGASGEEDTGISYWWDDIGGSAGVQDVHSYEESP